MDEILKNLNPEQKAAATHTYGPLMVLAGPGTGKTQILTARIATLLKLDLGINPDNILCLTFTESGASAMKERLSGIIGADAYRIGISTFHGFCEMVLNDYSHYFLELKKNRVIGEEIDKALALRKTLESLKDLQYYKPYWDEYFYQRELLGAISQLKRENITPQSFKDLIPQEKKRLLEDPGNFYKKDYREFKKGDFKPTKKKQIQEKVAKMLELSNIWESYEARLESEGFYDFDDQINWVVQKMCKSSDLRADLQERFQWILVDEYQDTNNSQNEILWQLCQDVPDPNIFVVGDDDQSIYRFQGASVENMLEFRTRFPQSKSITLKANYRSTQKILDTAFGVVEHNQSRLDDEKKLISQKPPLDKEGVGGDLITLTTYPSPIGEVNAIAAHIKEIGARGMEHGTRNKSHNTYPKPHTSDYSDIAILTRTNGEIAYFLHHLPSLGIPVQAHITDDLLSHQSAQYLILMIKVLADLSNDHDLIKLLHAPFLDIPASDLMKLSLHRSQEHQSILALLTSEDLPKLKAPEKLKAFYDFFIKARQDYFHLRPAVLCEKILYESGLAQYLNQTSELRNLGTEELKHEFSSSQVLKSSSLHDWHYVRSFIDWVRNQNTSTPKGLLEKIELHQTLGINVTPPPLISGTDAVQLLTAHRSKGLEFETVFIPGLWDKRWGNNKGRAMIPLPQINSTTLQLSNSAMETKSLQNCSDVELQNSNEDERRLFFVALTRAKTRLHLSQSAQDFAGRERNPSMFVHEIPNKLKNLGTQELKNEFTSPQVLKSSSFNDDDIKSLLENRIKNFVWSASSLQSYLDHPRKFLYQNLLRYPRKPMPHLALGVALHQALELYLRELNPSPQSPSFVKEGGRGGDLNRLLEHFRYALSGQNLSKDKYQELEKMGVKVLNTYFDQRLVLPSIHQQELEFEFHRFAPHIEEIRITGKVDKLVFLDAGKKTAKIVDYKSGKPKSIKQGESLWRQLVFYDLLARASKTFNTKILSTELEFLTPNLKGEIETKAYEVTPEDRTTLTQELKWAHQQLQNLQFPPVENPENDPDIEFWNTFGREVPKTPV